MRVVHRRTFDPVIHGERPNQDDNHCVSIYHSLTFRTLPRTPTAGVPLQMSQSVNKY